jgi:upstream activation factor subunit UAF30
MTIGAVSLCYAFQRERISIFTHLPFKRRMIMATSKRGSTRKITTKAAMSRKQDTRAKRAPNQGLMKAVQPSAQLAAVVGNKPMPRTEITKKIWDYIKDNKLQDAKNKRLINADARLRPVFGGKQQITMFELAKLVSQHVR